MSKKNIRILMNKTIAEALIESQGMTAENMHRQNQLLSIAYTYDHFHKVVDRMNYTLDTYLRKIK